MNARLQAHLPARAELCNALRFLAIDAVAAANSGHPRVVARLAAAGECADAARLLERFWRWWWAGGQRAASQEAP